MQIITEHRDCKDKIIVVQVNYNVKVQQKAFVSIVIHNVVPWYKEIGNNVIYNFAGKVYVVQEPCKILDERMAVVVNIDLVDSNYEKNFGSK